MVTLHPDYTDDFFAVGPQQLTIQQQADIYIDEMRIRSTPFVPTNRDRAILQWIGELTTRVELECEQPEKENEEIF